jgi:hypothetical protein
MPFPWVLAFKVIPWSDLIAAAPGVVRNAQKLWKQVGGSAAAGAGADAGAALAGQPPEQRLARLESELARMDEQLANQAEVIATLAEQNGKLVEAVEVLRQRTRLFGAAAALLALGLVVAFVTLG